jgi:hypothetical protein
MAALQTSTREKDADDGEEGDLDAEVASLSRVELVQMVVMGLGTGVEKSGAVVPAGWEAVVADYLNTTLQASEVVGFVRAFSNADRATCEGVINKFLAQNIAAKKTLAAFEVCIARTAADVPSGWQILITELSKLGALSCEKLEGLQTFVESAGKEEVEGVLMQFAHVLKERATKHRLKQEKALEAAQQTQLEQQGQQGKRRQNQGKQPKPPREVRYGIIHLS